MSIQTPAKPPENAAGAAIHTPSPLQRFGKRLLGAAALILLAGAVLGLGAALLRENAAGRADYADKTILITELCARNLTGIRDDQGHNGDWIELTNVSGQDISMAGWHITDDKRDLEKWAFPEGFVLPGSKNYITVLWADGQDYCGEENGHMHLNFSLSLEGETIYLVNSDGEIADRLKYPAQEYDVSYGRLKNSVTRTGFFASATPGRENPVAFLLEENGDALDSTVQYSAAPGFYPQEFMLTLTADDPEAVIVYTLDGSEPDTGSALYTGPLRIRDRCGEPNRYVTQDIVRGQNLAFVKSGVYTVNKCTVVKARTLKDGRLGPVSVSSYWVGTAPYPLPVISISARPEKLFGSEGIFSFGMAWHTFAKYNAGFLANTISGQRVPASFEMLAPDGTVLLCDNAEIHVSGGGGRTDSLQKNIAVSLDNQSYIMETGSGAAELSKFVLRGPGFGSTYVYSFQDAFLNNYLRAADTGCLGAQYSVPVIVYLEGEYWGVYMLKEKKTAGMLQYRYGVDPDSVILLDGVERTELDESIWLPYAERIDALDADDPEDMAWVEENFDLDNITQAVITELFISNQDGSSHAHNTILWRAGAQDGGAPCADGRWRVMLNDLDRTWVNPEDFVNPEPNGFYQLFEAETSAASSPAMPVALVSRLLKNSDYRLRFTRQFLEQMETTFNRDTLLQALTAWQDLLRPVMAENLARAATGLTPLGRLYAPLAEEPPEASETSMEIWEGSGYALYDYIAGRQDFVMGQLYLYCPEEMALLCNAQSGGEDSE